MTANRKNCAIFIPQALLAVGVLFSLMGSGWVPGGKNLSRLYVRTCKVFEVDSWLGHWLGVEVCIVMVCRRFDF